MGVTTSIEGSGLGRRRIGRSTESGEIRFVDGKPIGEWLDWWGEYANDSHYRGRRDLWHFEQIEAGLPDDLRKMGKSAGIMPKGKRA